MTIADFQTYMLEGEQISDHKWSVSVIIPFYGNWHLTHRRLMELYEHIRFPIEIVLIDDASPDNVREAVAWWEDNGSHNVRYFRNEENLGFGGSMNRGAEEATGEVLVFLSNDVTIHRDFISILLDEVEKNDQNLFGGRYINFDTGWNNLFINGKKTLFPYLEGWLLACTRDVWENIGYFDPIYEKFDYEDVDLSTMAVHNFYGLVELPCERFYQHQHGATIYKVYGAQEREKQTLKNQKKFIEKWSKILK